MGWKNYGSSNYVWPNNAHRTSYSQDGNEDISKTVIISLSLQPMTVLHVDC